MRMGRTCWLEIKSQIRFKIWISFVNDISFLLVKEEIGFVCPNLNDSLLNSKKQNNLRKGMRREKNNESRNGKKKSVDWKSTLRLKLRQETLDPDIFHEYFVLDISKDIIEKKNLEKEIRFSHLIFNWFLNSIVQKIQKKTI